MDYEETLLLLDAIEGRFAVVHPAGHGDDAGDFTSAPLWACGVFKRARSRERGGAAARRLFMANFERYRELRPELDLGGDAPLEAYERQAAHYTF